MTISAIALDDLTAQTSTKTGWVKMSETNLLILVGVTGVGKSTTVAALAAGGLSYTLLPNRRELTDAFMIRFLQQQNGDPITPVTDRAARFDLTRRYREQFPGGMGHTLAQLSVNPDVLTADWLIFDGLRGENEVAHAAKLLPKGRFLMLDAPDFVRVERLIKRNDAFDQIKPSAQKSSTADLGAATDLFNAAEIQALLGLVQQGVVSLAELKGKLEIVRKERQNYDPAQTKTALFNQARKQTIYVDTAKLSADEAAAFALAQLAASTAK